MVKSCIKVVCSVKYPFLFSDLGGATLSEQLKLPHIYLVWLKILQENLLLNEKNALCKR